MIRITAINGSPKTTGSISALLIEKLQEILNTKIDTFQAVKLLRAENASETVTGILETDVLLIVFPLYVDSIPAPLINLLKLMEQTAKVLDLPRPAVYAICNCGFYEAEHTRLALRMIRSFALRTGLVWKYGIGIGCGGFLPSVGKNMEKGPAANVHAVLCALSETIRTNEARQTGDVFVTPRIPRFVYKLAGDMNWRQMAKKNGVLRQLKAKPHNL